MAGKQKPPTEKQRRFAAIVAAQPPGEIDKRKCAVEAGYSERSAWVTADRMLKKQWMQDLIDELRGEAMQVAGVTVDRVTTELSAIAFADATSIIGPDGQVTPEHIRNLPIDTRRAIKSIQITDNQWGRNVKVEFYSKIEAMRLLASIESWIGAEADQTGGKTVTLNINNYTLNTGAPRRPEEREAVEVQVQSMEGADDD